MEHIETTEGAEMTAAKVLNFADMFTVSWEHEYYTDDDAASFETLEQAEAFAARLAEKGKRRIVIDGPGIDHDDDLGL